MRAIAPESWVVRIARALDALADGIPKRNDMVLFGGVVNPALPLDRQIGGRWFGAMGWDPHVLNVSREVQTGP